VKAIAETLANGVEAIATKSRHARYPPGKGCNMPRFAIAAGVLLATLLPPQAVAHDWYPVSCCSGCDCGPVPATEIEEIDWSHVRDKVTGGILTGSQIHESQDGEWHLCNRGCVRTGEPICVFRPRPAF
jgi:hypothetical protein